MPYISAASLFRWFEKNLLKDNADVFPSQAAVKKSA